MIDDKFDFKPSRPLTLGVELELQLISKRNCDLVRAATDLLSGLDCQVEHGDIKLEITESMIEVSTQARQTVGAIHRDLIGLRDILVERCALQNILIAGGGTHPFHRWPERRICPGERFNAVQERYGYLAKQFTVFGQHIHVGCPSGDQAIWLTQALNTFVPHFVALSAASPFMDGEDTLFQSARLNAVGAFPLSGQCPALADWEGFNAYFRMLRRCGVAQSIKDLYWDVRPKPEFGTVEIRVCDTPLTIETATAMAAFAQALVAFLLERRPRVDQGQYGHVARFNKFQACRYGFDAVIADPLAGGTTALRDDIANLLEQLLDYSPDGDCTLWLEWLRHRAAGGENDACWLRRGYEAREDLRDVVTAAAECFVGREAAHA
ncbi:MAG TPA: YbdK family carboxylate-amine ligase [Rhodocyclaceae bacterium]|nr:YbdK family carboxylate-amine ligase [Rhodocyclaceae bacterium]